MLSIEYTKKEMLRHLAIDIGADVSLEQEYLFEVLSNYSLDSLLEIASGKVKIKDVETAIDFIENFNDNIGLTFSDPSLIEISGGVVAALKLLDNLGQSFTEDFTDDTDFIYDVDKTEFLAGTVRQLNKKPLNAIFYASYSSDVDGIWGDGVLTGTTTGTVTVSGGLLNLPSPQVKYVDYSGVGNIDSAIQQGCVRVRYIPDYSGTSNARRVIFQSCKADSDDFNEIYIDHVKVSGDINVCMKDNAGVIIFDSVFQAGWNPVALQRYEFELNWDITAGANRLFIDGVQVGATDINTGVRDSSIGLIRLGSGFDGSDLSDFYYDDIIIFNAVQHTTNYTPDWSNIYENNFHSDVITLPTMAYAGAGSIQEFISVSNTETNSPRWIINGYFYSGGWAASSGTWVTSSPIADIIANISTLPVSDNIIFKIVTQESIAVQMNVDNLVLNYTGQIYSVANPYIDIDSIIDSAISGNTIVSWNNFLETTIENGSDLIKYVLSDDNGATYKYWDGLLWSASSGYIQSNTGLEVDTNISTFPTTINGIKIRIFLHSETGVTTPSIDNLVLNYNDFIYPTSNPAVIMLITLEMDALEEFVETSLKTGSDEIKYILSKDGIDFWYNSGWVVSDGTYSQSNTADEIELNKAMLITEGTEVQIKSLLHSFDGSTTPELDLLYVKYNADQNSSLTIALEEVKYEILIEYFAEEYEQGNIQKLSTSAINRNDFLTILEVNQRYMFFAEVFYACSAYLRNLDMENLQLSHSGLVTGSSFSVEGYSTSDTSGSANADKSALIVAAGKFLNKAKFMMLKAEYDVSSSVSRTRPRGF